jgi:hypothetical protein
MPPGVIRLYDTLLSDGFIMKALEMWRSSLAHERQSIIQAAHIAELERELGRLRAAPAGAPPDGTASADSGPVASKPSASSDAQAPVTQKGRWWTPGSR